MHSPALALSMGPLLAPCWYHLLAVGTAASAAVAARHSAAATRLFLGHGTSDDGRTFCDLDLRQLASLFRAGAARRVTARDLATGRFALGSVAAIGLWRCRCDRCRHGECEHEARDDGSFHLISCRSSKRSGRDGFRRSRQAEHGFAVAIGAVFGAGQSQGPECRAR